MHLCSHKVLSRSCGDSGATSCWYFFPPCQPLSSVCDQSFYFCVSGPVFVQNERCRQGKLRIAIRIITFYNSVSFHAWFPLLTPIQIFKSLKEHGKARIVMGLYESSQPGVSPTESDAGKPVIGEGIGERIFHRHPEPFRSPQYDSSYLGCSITSS